MAEEAEVGPGDRRVLIEARDAWCEERVQAARVRAGHVPPSNPSRQ